MHRPGGVRLANRDSASLNVVIPKKDTLIPSFNSLVGKACSTVSVLFSKFLRSSIEVSNRVQRDFCAPGRSDRILAICSFRR